MRQNLRASAAALGVLAAASAPAAAEEGMWTFDQFPAERMREQMEWAPDQAWLDRVMRATARLPGCSGAVVGGEGLLLTNHHCVVACLNQLSTERNLVAEGFAASTREEEARCPSLSVQVLQDISDVTARIETAAEQGPPEAFAGLRDAEIALIERECSTDGRRCEVVTLHQGGRYALYNYARYDDVRIAFTPEYGAAQFGGESDNFRFPRYGVDFALLRLYANGAPAATPQHLSLRFTPPEANEIVLAAGNPGFTSRLKTVAEMEFDRDVFLPWREAALAQARQRLATYSAIGAEEGRIANDALENIENYVKMYAGRRLALADADGMARVAASEADLRARVSRNLAAQREVGAAWEEVAQAQTAYREFFHAYQYAEARAGERSDLFAWARDIVRGAAERTKPPAQRLPRYSGDQLAGVERWVRTPRPVRLDWEALNLALWLSQTREFAPDALADQMLGDETPDALATRLASSRLADPAYRAELWEGGAAAVAASDDPMIVFVRGWDEQARALRTRFVNEVEAPTARAQERIARVRYRAFGDHAYPDATFSPRVSYGRVEGWTEAGADVAPFTHIRDMYSPERAPYAPTQRWRTRRASINGDAVLDFTTSTDIISGNSGSALLDREGRVVGLVFDGNMHSLGGEYYYDGARNRTVNVSAQAIGETLKLYDLDVLRAELGAR